MSAASQEKAGADAAVCTRELGFGKAGSAWEQPNTCKRDPAAPGRARGCPPPRGRGTDRVAQEQTYACLINIAVLSSHSTFP